MIRCTFILTLQLLPCVLLVSLGWGFDEFPSFCLSPARRGLALAVFAGAFVAILLRLGLQPIRRGSAPAGNQSLELGVLLLLSSFLLWFLPFADRRHILTFRHEYWRDLGLLVCCIGIVVRLLALKALGQHFSAYVTLQPNHRLIEDGIYAHIRHPLYLSLLLAPTGVAFVFASYLAFPILLLAAIFVWDRIRTEERLLAAHFGLPFEDFRNRTWMLVPWVF
jgi:protein-S-isoprenylcysteine O-methyltransferase Ste14